MAGVERIAALRPGAFDLPAWPDASAQAAGALRERRGPALGIIVGLGISLAFWAILLTAIL